MGCSKESRYLRAHDGYDYSCISVSLCDKHLNFGTKGMTLAGAHCLKLQVVDIVLLSGEDTGFGNSPVWSSSPDGSEIVDHT